jgi:serine/threonine-protein kinase RsbW
LRRRWLTTDRQSLFDWRIDVPATAATLADLHEILEGFWHDVERAHPAPPAARWRSQFSTAVLETATNVVRHSYPPAEPGRLQLRLTAFVDAIQATFTDTGAPYTPEQLCAGRSMPNPEDLAEGGYGLALIAEAVDDVSYDRTPAGENSWRLVKFLAR